jgi:hypothetical protein
MSTNKFNNLMLSNINTLKGSSYSYIKEAYEIISKQNFDFSTWNDQLPDYQYYYDKAVASGKVGGHFSYNFGKKGSTYHAGSTIYNYEKTLYIPKFGELILGKLAMHVGIKFMFNAVSVLLNHTSCTSKHFSSNCKIFDNYAYETLVLNLPQDGTIGSNIQRSINDKLEEFLPTTSILPWYKEAAKITTSQVGAFFIFDPMRAVEGASELGYSLGNLILYGELPNNSLHDQLFFGEILHQEL